jgi:predicted transcriptional regulator
MPKALSATVPDPLEARARAIAKQENRSLSNVVENALGVFTAFPEDLRDQLVARLAAGGPDDAALREAGRELMFSLARRRYEQARASLASSGLKAGPALTGVDDWSLAAASPSS